MTLQAGIQSLLLTFHRDSQWLNPKQYHWLWEPMDIVHILSLKEQSLIEKNAITKSMSQCRLSEDVLIFSNRYSVSNTANSMGLLRGKICSNPLSSVMIPPVLLGAKLVGYMVICRRPPLLYFLIILGWHQLLLFPWECSIVCNVPSWRKGKFSELPHDLHLSRNQYEDFANWIIYSLTGKMMNRRIWEPCWPTMSWLGDRTPFITFLPISLLKHKVWWCSWFLTPCG